MDYTIKILTDAQAVVEKYIDALSRTDLLRDLETIGEYLRIVENDLIWLSKNASITDDPESPT